VPSRRAFLATTATAAAAGAASAGCVGGVFESGTEAYLQFKSVSVSWTEGAQWYQADVLDVAHRVDEATVEGYYDPEYAASAVQPATRIEVGADLHDRLTREFDEVDYVLGACGEGFGEGDAVGCLNQRAGREDFDAAPLTGRVTLADRDDQFDVLDADPDEYAVEEVALRERAYDEWVDG
jgi:hypothetical protein